MFGGLHPALDWHILHWLCTYIKESMFPYFFLRVFWGFCIGLAHANQCYLTANSLFISVELRSEQSESMGAMRHFVSGELVSSVPSHQAGFDSFAQLHDELAWSTDWKGTAGSLQCHFLVLTTLSGRRYLFIHLRFLGGFTRHLIGTFSTGCALASRRVRSLIFSLQGF